MSSHRKLPHRKKHFALQAQNPLTHHSNLIHFIRSHLWGKPGERAFLPASVTVEASLILLPCLLVFFWVMSLFEMIGFDMRLQAETERLCRRAALSRLVEEQAARILPIEGEVYAMIGEALYTGISGYALERSVSEAVRETEGVFCHVTGVRVDIASLYREPETVDLQVCYTVSLPLFPDQTRLVRSRRRVWSGNDPPGPAAEEDRIVFVTVSGSVYHVSRECRHLTIRLREVSAAELPACRNLAGAKYYACEICRPASSAGPYYLTTDGVRYHSRTTCPALKRTIREVFLSEVKDRLRPCKTCGP